jgi:D-glycero-D-manno-heptose 1,7-bisphosphate phosphatase
MKTGKPCIFFDRDGIVNELHAAGYVGKWENFHLQPGFVAALRTVAAKGYPAAVITNQPGVAKGLYSEEELNDLHGQFRAQLRTHGVDVLDIFYCPHFSADHCDCRKPKPGMFLQASKKHGIDLSKSWMIGDAEKDVEAGRGAGCKTLRVCEATEKTTADFRVEHVDEIAALLERELAPCA